jgi:hypothetical protein
MYLKPTPEDTSGSPDLVGDPGNGGGVDTNVIELGPGEAKEQDTITTETEPRIQARKAIVKDPGAAGRIDI